MNRISSSAVGILAVLTGSAGGATTVQIIADNDFALYAGTATTITRQIYQNDVDWPDQIAAAASVNITLEPGESFFYLLAMGAGWNQDSISGQINGVNIVDVFDLDNSAIEQSSNIQPWLSGYDLPPNPGDVNAVVPLVEDGSYTASLSDVQTGLLNVTSWGQPDPVQGHQTILDNPFSMTTIRGGKWGFDVTPYEAVFFRFGSEEVNVPPGSPIPEPAGAASVMAVVLLGTLLGRRRAR